MLSSSGVLPKSQDILSALKEGFFIFFFLPEVITVSDCVLRSRHLRDEQ